METQNRYTIYDATTYAVNIPFVEKQNLYVVCKDGMAVEYKGLLQANANESIAQRMCDGVNAKTQWDCVVVFMPKVFKRFLTN